MEKQSLSFKGMDKKTLGLATAAGLVVAGLIIAPAMVSSTAEDSLKEKLKTESPFDSYGEIACSYSFNPACSIKDIEITSPPTPQTPHPMKFSSSEITISNLSSLAVINKDTILNDGESATSVITVKDIHKDGERWAWSDSVKKIIGAKGIDQNFLNGYVKSKLDAPTDLVIEFDASNSDGVIDQYTKISLSHKAASFNFASTFDYKAMKDGVVFNNGDDIHIKTLSTGFEFEDEIIPKTLWEFYKVDLKNRAAYNERRAKKFNSEFGSDSIEPVSYDKFVEVAAKNLNDVVSQNVKSTFGDISDDITEKIRNIVLGDESSFEIKLSNKDNLTINEMSNTWMGHIMSGNGKVVVDSLEVKIN